MTRTLALMLLLTAPLPAQPTYRLDVRKDLKPAATLSVDKGRIVRSDVT